ncbi:MAG TPA: hypothetical protein VNH22_19285 [Blastocatellia bacterium]|jgi:hypothetical protein|nr:hypothetical protein [Blastocatellia bacterium]
MIGTDHIDTVAVKLCAACGGGLLERDRFCRWCGIPQQSDTSELNEKTSERPLTAPRSDNSTSLYTTSSLQQVKFRQIRRRQAGFRSGFYRPVSGPLVNAMLAGVSTGHARPLYSRLVRKTVFALVSIPIWLLIVLLSPIDACAAAREIARDY